MHMGDLFVASFHTSVVNSMQLAFVITAVDHSVCVTQIWGCTLAMASGHSKMELLVEEGSHRASMTKFLESFSSNMHDFINSW
jgi:hypothetical protein